MATITAQNPGSTEIQSPFVAGLSEAISRLSTILALDTKVITDVQMYAVPIDSLAKNKNRIYEDRNNRLWLTSPAPVFKKNGEVISQTEYGFSIDHIGGSITFQEFNKPEDTDTITVSATCINKDSQQIEDILSSINTLTQSSSRYKGSFNSLDALNVAYPTANIGDIALVVYYPAIFAWNGTKWADTRAIEDLSNFYTKNEVDVFLNQKENSITEQGSTATSDNYYLGGRKTWQNLNNKVRNSPLSGISFESNADVQNEDTVITAIGKLQAKSSETQKKVMLSGNGAPTTSTVGSIGQRYTDKSKNDIYICYDNTNGVYKWSKYFNGDGVLNLDRGSITGSDDSSALDDMTEPGTYTFLDSSGVLGKAGSLWNIVVSNSRFNEVIGHESVTQTAVETYRPGLMQNARILTRSYYYANDPVWTSWRELADISQLPHPNILDNWYFLDPINQRGKTEYTAGGYTVDRWGINSGNLYVTAGGIKIDTGVVLQQELETEVSNGQPMTISYMDSAGAVYWMLIPRQDYKTFGDLMAVYLGKRLYIRSNNSNTVISAIKLELGTEQTLARKVGDTWVLNDPPPDPALELMKCQRYYWQSWAGNDADTNLTLYGAIVCEAINAYRLNSITFPVTMRAVPSVSIFSANPSSSGVPDRVNEWNSDTAVDHVMAIYGSPQRFFVSGDPDTESKFEVGKHYYFHCAVSAEI